MMTMLIPNYVPNDKRSNTQKEKVHFASRDINPTIQTKSQGFWKATSQKEGVYSAQEYKKKNMNVSDMGILRHLGIQFPT